MTDYEALRKAAEQAIDTLFYYASVCGEDEQDTPAKQAQAALRAALAEPTVKESLTAQPPNIEGETMCVVRWMAETPRGGVGSYDRAALECLEVKP